MINPRLKKKQYLLGAIAGFTCLGSLWFYFTPYFTYQGMKQAADRGDSSAISENVDFPNFRESVKTAIKSRMGQEVTKTVEPNNPFAALGAMLTRSVAGVVVDPLVDNLVTPEGITTILQGKAQLSGNRASEASAQTVSSPDVSMGYKSFNSFAVTINTPVEGEMSLIFLRNGLSWKLSELKLPSATAN